MSKGRLDVKKYGSRLSVRSNSRDRVTSKSAIDGKNILHSGVVASNNILVIQAPKEPPIRQMETLEVPTNNAIMEAFSVDSRIMEFEGTERGLGSSEGPDEGD